MTYTTKLIVTDRNGIESAIADYLNTETLSTIHAIDCFVRGSRIYVVLIHE